MIKILATLVLGAGLIYLVRRRLLHVDLSFFILAALFLLSAASISNQFIDATARFLGIIFPPLAIILIALFLILCLVILLAIYLTRLRARQVSLIRYLARIEIHQQFRERPNTKLDEYR